MNRDGLEDRRGRPPVKPFERRYTAAEALGTGGCGPDVGAGYTSRHASPVRGLWEESFDWRACPTAISTTCVRDLPAPRSIHGRGAIGSVVSPIGARASCVSTPSIRRPRRQRACTTSTSGPSDSMAARGHRRGERFLVLQALLSDPFSVHGAPRAPHRLFTKGPARRRPLSCANT